MAQWIRVLGSTTIAGNVRHACEGAIAVSDTVAERLAIAGVLDGEPVPVTEDGVVAVDEGPALAQDGYPFDDEPFDRDAAE